MIQPKHRTVVGKDGERWVIEAVVYDHAGPESVRLIRQVDLETGRREAALILDLAQWCRFCEIRGIAAQVLL